MEPITHSVTEVLEQYDKRISLLTNANERKQYEIHTLRDLIDRKDNEIRTALRYLKEKDKDMETLKAEINRQNDIETLKAEIIRLNGEILQGIEKSKDVSILNKDLESMKIREDNKQQKKVIYAMAEFVKSSRSLYRDHCKGFDCENSKIKCVDCIINYFESEVKE
jgi:predicted RNase H-like nuclease (RuvC/YqgF family)